MITIELLTETNFHADSLDHYVRTQQVRQVYRRVNGEYTLVELPYVEDWSLERKRQIAQALSGEDCISYLALEADQVVGFIGPQKQLNSGYMILDMMHVAAGCRGQGLGRALFQKGMEEAKKAGAKGLYISACSSRETIAFYRAMGAALTEQPIAELAEEEPYDLQMVCLLT